MSQHDDDHHGHAHGHLHHGNERRTLIAALLTGGFMFVEAVGGLLAGSLALVADAAHMLTDAISLGFAWFAFRLAAKPPDHDRTYGYHRFQILVAFANGLALLFIIAWIVFEAIDRLTTPKEVLGGMMAAVAFAGLVANIIAFLVLHGANRENLNIRGAILHVLGDLLGSVAALIAAGVIIWTGWTPIDPILSLLVALILVRSAWTLIRDSAHILLEGTPRNIDIGEIKRDLASHIKDVTDIHHVHVWSLTQERTLITLHARLETGDEVEACKAAIRDRLKQRFGIDHATVEIETGPMTGCPAES